MSERSWPEPVYKRNTKRNHKRANDSDDGCDDELAGCVSTYATCLRFANQHDAGRLSASGNRTIPGVRRLPVLQITAARLL